MLFRPTPLTRCAIFPAIGPALALSAALALLAGCGKAPDAAAPAAPTTAAASATAAPQAAVTVEAVAAEGVGFSVGSSMAAHTVYVFFDPQCPHCTDLWKAARPLTTRARFVWMPVGLLNDKSRIQGAALLASNDPVAAMDAHEASMQTGQGGIAAAAGADKQLASVVTNTALLTRLDFTSIPTLVAKHAQTGALVTHQGSMSTPALAALLGLPIPAASSAAQGS
jgi:thiol:disulfide interchange protein DsbG